MDIERGAELGDPAVRAVARTLFWVVVTFLIGIEVGVQIMIHGPSPC